MNKKLTTSICVIICSLWAPKLLAEVSPFSLHNQYAEFTVIVPEQSPYDYYRYQQPTYHTEKVVKKSHVKQVKKVSAKKAKAAKETYPTKVAGSRSNSFVFNPRNLTWTAYDAAGNVVKSGRASGGKKYCPDVKRACKTPVGTFRLYSKGGPGCKSSKFPVGKGGAPMPYCMFFRGGYAIHGSNDVPGHNASHGCIRVLPSAARWLSQFLGHGAKIVVKSY